jgi:hypothetical protein
MRLFPDEKGEGGGEVTLRTGVREAAELKEWQSPMMPGRWYQVRVAYDRNAFEIYVDGRLAAVRSDRKNAMKADADEFVIGGGYQGGFDTLVISGIYEDDDDRTIVSGGVAWINDAGEPRTNASSYIYFKNRGLDPRFHTEPLEYRFKLLQFGNEGGAVRKVQISLSGEAFIKRVDE